MNKIIYCRKTFEIYRNKLPGYFKKDSEPKLWSFNAEIPFHRVIAFLDRLNLLIVSNNTVQRFFFHSLCVANYNAKIIYQDFFGSVIDFQKLDRIELAGIKGRNLGFKVTTLIEEFQKAWNLFVSVAYDPLDPDIPDFLADYEKFKLKAYDFDRRLASIFVQAFDECSNMEGLFKVIEFSC